MSYTKSAVAALFVAIVVAVQGHPIIYVDTENGTLNSSCWEGGLDLPCGSLELADAGALRHNSTIALLFKHGTGRSTPAKSPTIPQVISCPPWSATENGTRTHEPSTQNDSLVFNSLSIPSRIVSCPPWFSLRNDTCKCGPRVHDVVRCNETLRQSAVLDCYCMTYGESTGTVVGACFYNCVNNNALKDVVYHPMPNNLDNLTVAMCGYLNRSGQLCGECEPGLSPPAYSYELHCTACTDSWYNWVIYVAVAFLPLTVFLVLVLCCRISATSPQLCAFVTFSQGIAIPANVRVIIIGLKHHSSASVVARILLALYGVWNLDFFRTLMPSVACLQVDTLQALALDYGIAFYPLALIFVSYILIELHAHNVRIIVWLGRPFHTCFARFRQQWNVKTSIIDAFATFLILSNVKLLSVSFDLLTPTIIYNVNGSVIGLYLYYDASIEFFGRTKHLPYAIVALFVVLILVLFPLLLLLLYPMQWFQRCLGRLGVRWHALHIFIDSFQGNFKDGTNGTRDCRYFAGVYLSVRLLLFVVFAFTLGAFYYAVGTLVLIAVAMLIAIVQPYKPELAVYNAVDSVFVLTLAMWYGTLLCVNIAAVKIHRLLKFSVLLSCLVGTLPLLYIVVISLYWICSRRRIGRTLFQSIKTRIKRGKCGTGIEDSLPDRLVNPQLYHNAECRVSVRTADSTERLSNQTYSSYNSITTR